LGWPEEEKRRSADKERGRGEQERNGARGEKVFPLIPTFLDEKANYQFVSDSSMKPILPIDQRTA